MYQSNVPRHPHHAPVTWRRTLTGVLTAALLVPLAAGCGMNKAEQGAIIGAGTGGVAGAVVGKATGSTVRGAIIGAAVGGVAGAVIGHQMDRHAEELAYQIPGATVQRIGEGIVVTFPDGLLFNFDSDQLLYAARENLRKVATSLETYQNTRLLVVGHTDSQGSDVYNMGLSERRASAAVGFIVSEGIPRDRTSTAGRGEGEPIATNDTDDGRQQNRRVEIAIFSNNTAQ